MVMVLFRIGRLIGNPKKCGQCKDIDGDGKIDFVDFNSDNIAQMILEDSTPDGIGDHTFDSRLDATESVVEDEETQFCGGNPILCLHR